MFRQSRNVGETSLYAWLNYLPTRMKCCEFGWEQRHYMRLVTLEFKQGVMEKHMQSRLNSIK